jgi:hypothetical protein
MMVAQSDSAMVQVGEGSVYAEVKVVSVGVSSVSVTVTRTVV